MSDFPDWAQDRLVTQGSQVSHGLNLVLKLKNPAKLPLMLWDIVLAQDKIKRALEELSFVHFARFIPSWDGCALMVTTEFDGRLDPYVLDFVTALGDVFDTLLSYVETPPEHMPVREHPDEFLKWVREWNRVPFLPSRLDATMFPAGFDYPVYSAYPHKTVTDIAGRRNQVLMPALDHPAAAVDPEDVQGNILRGYNAKHASYMFFTVTDAAVARRWLAQDLPAASGNEWLGVANAVPWSEGKVPPPVLTQVAFTHAGVDKLLAQPRKSELAAFPNAFKEGAAERAEANFDTGNSAPDRWLFGKPTGEPEHVVLFLYTKESGADKAAYDRAVQELEGGAALGLKHLRTLTGESLSGYEHFGFRDGISEPRISGQMPPAEPAYQPAASPGEFLLHKDYASLYGGTSLGRMSEHLATNGSFGVLRLLEQNVDEFNACTDREAARLGVDPERLRAKLVGRWKNGAPLALAPDTDRQAGPVNAFDYAPSWEFPDEINDHEGMRCPVGAHIRRANPRTARVAGQRYGRRLLRRGMPSEWLGEDGKPKVGLMGLFMGANIEQQFEFIQREWLQGGLAASGVRDTTDAIAAIRNGDTDFPFIEPIAGCPHAPPRSLVAHIPPLVTTRGCMYLFFPGLTALRNLDATASKLADIAQKVTKAGQAITQVGKEVVATAGGAAGDLVNVGAGVLTGIAGTTRSVVGALVPAVEAISAIQSHLPDLDVSPFIATPPKLEVLLEMPALWGLADGDWREFIKALAERKLDSNWVKRTIESFAPPLNLTSPPPGIEDAGIDIADARFRANPYDALRQLRETGKRIVWVGAQNACWVLGHDDCKELFDRDQDFVQAPASTKLRGIVTLDKPQHDVVSKAYAAAFTTALARVAPDPAPAAPAKSFIDVTIEQAIERLLRQPHLLHFDFMREFAHPVARSVVWALIGIRDEEEQKACDALADKLVLSYGRTAQPNATQSMVSADAGLRLAARLSVAWLVSSSPLSPYKGTLIGELAARMGPGLPFPHQRPLGFIETLLTVVQTVLASQSPHFLLGSAALRLLSPDPRPEKGGAIPWYRLAELEDRDNNSPFKTALGLALDEARRCDTPLSMVERYANGEQEICGFKVPDGCAVFAMVASANRHTKHFGPLAEQFHFDRPQGAAHLSLGYGSHECAGRELQARLVPAALGAFIKAMPDLRLSNPTAVPAWHATIYFRQLQALSVARC